MAFLIDRTNGQNYAENLVNPALSFNDGTWTVSSGTGTSTLFAGEYIEGLSSLRIQNNTPASDITVTNISQTTTIETPGLYQLSLFLKKDIALEERQVDVLIYQNAVLLDTQTCKIGSTSADEDINDVWLRFQSTQNYTFSKSDEITFQFTLRGAVTGEATTVVYVDALMLNLAGRNNAIVPNYRKPLLNPTDLVAKSLKYNELSTAPASASDTGELGEVRIDADYIYVCTATDTWKRVAITTW